MKNNTADIYCSAHFNLLYSENQRKDKVVFDNNKTPMTTEDDEQTARFLKGFNLFFTVYSISLSQFALHPSLPY